MSRRHLAPRLVAYLAVAGVLMELGVVSGRGGLVALGAPLGLAVLVAVALGAPPAVGRATVLGPPLATSRAAALIGLDRPPAEATTHVEAVEAVEVDEGDEVVVVVALAGHRRAVVDVALALPAGVELADGAAARRLRLDGQGRAEERFVVRADRWGRHHLGVGVVRSTDPLGLVADDEVLDDRARLRVRPAVERVRTAVRPARLRLASGAHPARVTGPGIEFAGIRPYQAGDRLRDLSWRGSARRDQLMVTQRHPERSADVVLFVDSFAAEGLPETVRAAVTVARHQLGERDRVGLVVFGGSMRVVRPAAGSRQQRMLAEALADIRPVFSWADKEIRAIPPRMLPPGATVLVISPLVDERTIGAVGDLRRRRHDVAVIEVSPARWAPAPATTAQIQAWRLWEMQREARRQRLAAAGVAVVQWHDGIELERPLAELARRGRQGRPWLAS